MKELFTTHLRVLELMKDLDVHKSTTPPVSVRTLKCKLDMSPNELGKIFKSLHSEGLVEKVHSGYINKWRLTDEGVDFVE